MAVSLELRFTPYNQIKKILRTVIIIIMTVFIISLVIFSPPFRLFFHNACAGGECGVYPLIFFNKLG